MRKILTTAAACFLILSTFVTLTYAQTVQITPLPGLMEDVKKIADKTNPERLEVLKGILSEMNIPFSVESFTAAGRGGANTVTVNNLLVSLGSGAGTIVIGAHYDKVSVGSGVIDNGCASIILTRLAKNLAQEKLNHKIHIVWFDKEESGLVGSAQYVQAYKDESITAMINLDVDGYGDTIMLGPAVSGSFNQLFRTARLVCAENDINCILFPRYGGSDNISFQRAGIETISIGITTAPEAHQFWLSLNGGNDFQIQGSARIMSNMHSENDKIDLVEPQAMTIVYTLVLNMVKKLNVN